VIFRQLFEEESSTYTYLFGSQETGEALLLDPVMETVERDLEVIADLGSGSPTRSRRTSTPITSRPPVACGHLPAARSLTPRRTIFLAPTSALPRTARSNWAA